MILYYFSLKMEGNKIKSLAKSQYDTLLLADKLLYESNKDILSEII